MSARYFVRSENNFDSNSSKGKIMTMWRKILLVVIMAFAVIPAAYASISFENLTNERVPLYIEYPHVDGTSDWKLIISIPIAPPFYILVIMSNLQFSRESRPE